MQTVQKDQQIICRLEVGDEIITELKYLAATIPDQFGAISGIGACDDVTVSIYSPSRDEYVATRSQEQVELLSLNGNVENAAGKIAVHLHSMFARLDTSVFGGHLERAVISRTGELVIDLVPVVLGRTEDHQTKLQVLDIQS